MAAVVCTDPHAHTLVRMSHRFTSTTEPPTDSQAQTNSQAQTHAHPLVIRHTDS